MAYGPRQTQWCENKHQDTLTYEASRTQADGVDCDPNFVTLADLYHAEIAGADTQLDESCSDQHIGARA